MTHQYNSQEDDMDFGFTLAEEKLRQEVRDLLKKEVTP
jgi:hypothetical protein